MLGISYYFLLLSPRPLIQRAVPSIFAHYEYTDSIRITFSLPRLHLSDSSTDQTDPDMMIQGHEKSSCVCLQKEAQDQPEED